MIPLLIADIAEAMLLDKLTEEMLNDDSPSSAVQSAHWNPLTNSVEVTFRKGGHSYSFPCSLEDWVEYKSADSKGGAINDLMGN